MNEISWSLVPHCVSQYLAITQSNKNIMVHLTTKGKSKTQHRGVIICDTIMKHHLTERGRDLETDKRRESPTGSRRQMGQEGRSKDKKKMMTAYLIHFSLKGNGYFYQSTPPISEVFNL